ncbi:MAG: cysteine--tRNA ligase [Treponema sp.]|nr:cysteine--tRNA ligase [Treponema sp.]
MQHGTELKLFNTLGRKLERFEPIIPGKTGFYGCGLTVYNYAHIGNLRAYITHDILVRTLRRFGYDVTHVMNITDVGHLSGDNDEGDDKMVKSAAERGKSVLEIAEFYTQAFLGDMEKLNIARPSIICKATDHVGDMISLIKRIEANGFTYSSGGNLYFDISKFPNYGDLALLRLDELKAGARTDMDNNKKNPGDFVLWFTKSKFENQALVWDSPWGRGYPGWHIECSAMSIKYLGETFDIHAGGIDHIPIHHTNEIAQSEAATGKHPWVKYWVHNEFLLLDKEKKEKMSKSTGSFITLNNLIDEGYDPLDYRYFLLGGHYRSQLKFSFDALNGAKNSRKSLMEKIRSLSEKAGGTFSETTATDKYINAFNEALADDLNTPRALAELWGLLKDASISPNEALSAVYDMDGILGLNLSKEAVQKTEGRGTPELITEIENLINERKQAKDAKNYARADEIRQILKERGVILEDSPSGTSYRML